MSTKGLSIQDLPYDVRILVYETILANHLCVNQNRQPSNDHIRVLHTCRQIFYEARAIFHKYVSLRNDWEVDHYLTYLDSEPKAAPVVRWADVANDGRVLESTLDQTGPASRLYLVLAKFVSLEKVRVFNVRHCYPHTISIELRGCHVSHCKGSHAPLASIRTSSGSIHKGESFQMVPSNHIRSLRLSGDCRFRKTPFPSLRHLTIRGVTSNAFDQIRFNTSFSNCQLDSFIHAQGHRLGFEITNVHLESLLAGPDHAFVNSSYWAVAGSQVQPSLHASAVCPPLGPSLQVLKLQITHAWYALPLFEEERNICDTIEERILLRHLPHKVEHVSFHSQLMAEHGREDRWSHIAAAQHISLKIGPWEDEEET
ncbi:uncharacterized protein BJ212DRAFT_319414 [Suillus subaureus]|uniref:Uncharacterized protein n=1 Tax=Suillus subaureus TaxID=48587 RepID=A0A9P7EMZ7_9AGAM|nr:uncharacterized protein BJ212DRAFT_319414 [Suillus subaureus]KAG1826023.1 hypothetical protein BJ212DRAFT_319414 [Suillus subaureus]